MDEVLEQAQKLAGLLASHERTKAFHDAAAAVQADPEASRIQEAYATALEEVHRREAAGQPIEPEQKRAVMAAQDQVRRSAVLMRMLKAHAEYVELMDAVQAILSGATQGEGEHEHGPGCDHDHGPSGEPEKREEEPPQKSVLWTP